MTRAEESRELHLIDDVKFVVRTNDGPLVCTCGENMLASQYPLHRQKLGLSAGGISRVRMMERDAEMPSHWRKGICRVTDCDEPSRVRGYCNGHYQRMRRGLDVNVELRPGRNPNGRPIRVPTQ